MKKGLFFIQMAAFSFTRNILAFYVPRTLAISHDQCQTDYRQLAAEILTLTKMNWNNSQITALEPITLRAARQVGRIMKYANVGDLAVNYRFFM